MRKFLNWYLYKLGGLPEPESDTLSAPRFVGDLIYATIVGLVKIASIGMVLLGLAGIYRFWPSILEGGSPQSLGTGFLDIEMLVCGWFILIALLFVGMLTGIVGIPYLLYRAYDYVSYRFSGGATTLEERTLYRVGCAYVVLRRFGRRVSRRMPQVRIR